MCDSGAWCREKALVKLYGRADNCDVPLPRPAFGGPSMRSRFFVCAALAGFAFAHGQSRVAHAADPKAKNAKKKGDDSAEDKTGIGKTLQWEDKVMGPDDKRSELDKIRQAQAINKAAAEKAERDKAANAAREAKEKEAAAKAGPTTQKRGGEVALPTLPDEGPTRARSRRSTPMSRRSSRRRGRRSAAAHAEAGRRQVHRQAAEGRVGGRRRSGPRPPRTRRWSTCWRRRSRARPRRARRARRTASTIC